jgi:hypothetical protein
MKSHTEAGSVSFCLYLLYRKSCIRISVLVSACTSSIFTRTVQHFLELLTSLISLVFGYSYCSQMTNKSSKFLCFISGIPKAESCDLYCHPPRLVE